MHPDHSHRKFFNEQSHLWDRDENEEKMVSIAQIFQEYIPVIGEKTLDVGCGTGVLVPLLMQASPPGRVILELDFSIMMLKKNLLRWYDAKDQVKQVNGDALQLPFPDQLFHFVVCFAIIPHLSNKKRALEEIFRVMADSGKIMILHLMSSYQLNRFHSEAGDAVSEDHLPPVSEMSDLMHRLGYCIDTAIERDGLYLILGEKKR